MDPVELVQRYIREATIGRDEAVAADSATDNVNAMLTLFHDCFTDLRLNTLGPLFASADGAHVACSGEIHLRQIREYLHVNAVGHTADCGFVAIYHIADGKITNFWGEFDFAQLYTTA
jgi:hypothetical protein